MDVPTMQKCSGCKVVWYCGPVCQKKDWKEGGENKHKLQCPRIKEQRELCKEKKKEEAKEEAEELNERWQREERERGLQRKAEVWDELKEIMAREILEQHGDAALTRFEELLRDHQG